MFVFARLVFPLPRESGGVTAKRRGWGGGGDIAGPLSSLTGADPARPDAPGHTGPEVVHKGTVGQAGVASSDRRGGSCPLEHDGTLLFGVVVLKFKTSGDGPSYAGTLYRCPTAGVYRVRACWVYFYAMLRSQALEEVRGDIVVMMDLHVASSYLGQQLLCETLLLEIFPTASWR